MDEHQLSVKKQFDNKITQLEQEAEGIERKAKNGLLSEAEADAALADIESRVDEAMQNLPPGAFKDELISCVEDGLQEMAASRWN